MQWLADLARAIARIAETSGQTARAVIVIIALTVAVMVITRRRRP